MPVAGLARGERFHLTRVTFDPSRSAVFLEAGGELRQYTGQSGELYSMDASSLSGRGGSNHLAGLLADLVTYGDWDPTSDRKRPPIGALWRFIRESDGGFSLSTSEIQDLLKSDPDY